jgi:hypothetical protein
MKKSILFLIAIFGVFGLFAQETSPLTFKTTKHSFGKIQQKKPVTVNFTFTNTSGKVVIVENATAECGCTTPEYPKGAIAKGATNQISVTYNAEAMGSFTKKVTVKLANVAEPVYLYIEGEVVEAKGIAKDKLKIKTPKG